MDSSQPTKKDFCNEKAVGDAIAEFAKRVHETLHSNGAMHGSITLTLHCAYGQIKKFDMSVDETRLCKS